MAHRRTLALLLAATLWLPGCGHASGPLASAVGDRGLIAADAGAPPSYPAPTFTSNEVDVIYDMACFDAMEQLVSNAQHSIRLDYYIFSGPTASRLADILIAKHQAGVQVQVIVDGAYGSVPEMKNGELPVLDKLKKAGVPLAIRSRKAIPPATKNNTIDHSKYFVVDESDALLGSMNIAKKFYNFHDLMMHARGPVAQAIAQQFDFDWYYATHPEAPVPTNMVHADPAGDMAAPGPDGPGMVRLVGTGFSRKTGLEALLSLLANAKQSIHVQMHEIGDPRILDALVAARDRGVDVRLILDPGDIDPFVPVIHDAPKGIVNAVALDKLLKAKMNVRTYRVDAQFTTAHMKSCVIDGQTMFAGSINWTRGGFESVNESDLEIHGGRAPAEAEKQFQSDWVQRSTPAEPPTATALAIGKIYERIEGND